MRFVIDSNVLISHLLLSDSVPAKTVTDILAHHHVFTADAQLLELQHVLERPKFDRYVSGEDRQLFLYKFYKAVRIVEIVRRINLCRDATDNTLLEIAIASQANAIISGDRDLLALHPFEHIAVISPAEYLKKYLA